MLGLKNRRHHARHGRDTEPVPPRYFWDLLLHDQKVREGRWTDPRFEDMYACLRREYEDWRRQHGVAP